MLKFENEITQNAVEVPAKSCLVVAGTWSNDSDSPSVKLQCSVVGEGKQTSSGYQAPSVAISIAYGGKNFEGSGDYNATASVELFKVKVGENSADNICIDFSGDTKGNASCKLAR